MSMLASEIPLTFGVWCRSLSEIKHCPKMEGGTRQACCHSAYMGYSSYENSSNGTLAICMIFYVDIILTSFSLSSPRDSDICVWEEARQTRKHSFRAAAYLSSREPREDVGQLRSGGIWGGRSEKG